jgi:hypothetical protein
LNFRESRKSLPNELVLNPGILSKAMINYGDVMSVIHEKISNNETLKIAVIGGSISCGQSGAFESGYVHPDKPKGIKGAWPQVLQTMFDEDRGGASIMVENLCAGGVGSDYWIDRITAASQANSSKNDRSIQQILRLRTTDILILELAVNDWPLCHPEACYDSPNYELFAFDAQRKAELLVAVIRALFPNIQIMFLGISSVLMSVWNGTIPRRFDGVHAQLEVTKAHGIPHLSVIDGLGPFRSNVSKDWYLHTYRSDEHAHITGFGHEIAAFLMHQFLISHYWSQHQSMFPNEPQTKHSLTWTSQEELDKFTPSHPVRINLLCRSWMDKKMCQQHVMNVSGWAVLEDVKGRPGFISTELLSSFTVLFSREVVEKHAQVGELTVSHLNSYKDMGCFKVLLQDHDMKHLNETIVDTLWTLEESVYESSTILFHKLTSALNVTITNVDCPHSSGLRQLNKIKLQSVTMR